MRVDDRPTIAAPDDDPYLWLEEVEGERALDFAEQQNRRTLETFRRRAICGRSRHCWPLSTTGRTTFPMSRAMADFSTISGRIRKIRAASGGERRSKNFASRIRNGMMLLDIDKLAAEEKPGLAAELDQPLAGKTPAQRSWAFRAAAATPSRCGNSTSTRRPSSPTASCCRKQKAASPGSMPIRCCCRAPMARAWRRHPAMPEPSG